MIAHHELQEGDRPVTTSRHASRLLLTNPDNLRPKDTTLLKQIVAACPEMTALASLVRGFAALLTPAAGNDAKLTQWIAAARAVDLPHLRSLTNDLEIDRCAVDAALTLPYRNGRTEGVNTRTTPDPTANSSCSAKVAASTVWQILKDAGIDPASQRITTTWSALLRSQADALLASDFFETSTSSGTRLYVLAVIEHTSRRIRVPGGTTHPTASWDTQAAKTSSWTSKRGPTPALPDP